MTVEIDRDVRLAVYEHFVDTGVAPAPSAIAARAGIAEAEVRSSMERLAESRALVLEPGTGGLWMAMPFSAVPTPFRVRWNGREAFANCAWDALGIPAMLQADADIETVDPIDGSIVRLEVRGGRLATPDGVVHFAVPAREWWKDIGFT